MFLGIRKVLISALLMISMITFLVVCFGFSIVTLSKAKVISENNYIFSVENINFEFGKKFSQIRLKIYKCNLHDLNTGEDFEIVSDAYFSFNLNMIYKGFKNSISGEADKTIFHFHVNGINFDAIADFNKKQKSNNQLIIGSQDHNEVLLKNITSFFKKYYVKNLRLSLQFKAFNLNKLETINNRLNKNLVSIQKISFSTVDGDNNYIGNVKINYSLNNTTNSLSILLVRESEKITYIKAQVYGLLNSHIQLKNGMNVCFNDFLEVFFSYDVNNKFLSFDGRFNKISLKSPEIISKTIEFVDGIFTGSYDYYTGVYDIQNINFSLVNNKKKYRFIGSLSQDEFFQLTVSSIDVINFRVLLDYLPVKLQRQSYDVLIKTIQHGDVQHVNFFMKNFPGMDDVSASTVKLDLKLVDLMLHYTPYNITLPETNLLIDETNVSIKASKGKINGDLNLSNINIQIPLINNKKSEIKFDFSCSTNAIVNILKSKTNEVNDLSHGNIEGKVIVNIPNKTKLKLIDLSINSKVSLKDIMFRNKVINSNDLDFSLYKGKIITTGNISFDKIEIKNLVLDGRVSRSNFFKMKSLNFKLPLSQKKIQSILEKIHLKIDGNCMVSVDEDNKFILNLSETSINPKFGIVKHANEFGSLEFRLKHKILKDLKLILPNIELQGEVNFNNNQVVSAALYFEKFHSSKFELKYNFNRSEDDEYFINADKIDISDIKKILVNSTVEKQNKDDDSKFAKLVFRAKSITDQSKKLMSDVVLFFVLHNNKLLKIDGSGYVDNNGYIRVFFDEPVFALIINNTGFFIKKSFNIKSLDKGNLELYGLINEKDKNLRFSGELYTYNFKLAQSFLLSTILKIYSLSGFSVMNIFQMFNKGINFSSMHCFVASDDRSILFDKCQAFSDTMLLSLEAHVGIDGKKGKIEGLIIPKTILNTPVILLQKFLSKKGKTLLDGMDDKQNFSISWNGDEKPIINTNPISFILPSIFSNLFSKNKTINDQQQS